MIINGFGGGSVWNGNSVLLKTYTGSFDIGARGSSAKVNWTNTTTSCSSTSYAEAWACSETATVANWTDFDNFDCKAIKLVFKITSISGTGVVGLFANKNSTTATQYFNGYYALLPTVRYQILNAQDWQYPPVANPSNTYVLFSDKSYGGHVGSFSHNVSSVPSSGSTLTTFTYGTEFSWQAPTSDTSACFAQIIKNNGHRYWKQVRPLSDINRYGWVCDGDITLNLKFFAMGASGGSGNMYWHWFTSEDTSIWPPRVYNYLMEVYGIS